MAGASDGTCSGPVDRSLAKVEQPPPPLILSLDPGEPGRRSDLTTRRNHRRRTPPYLGHRP